MRVVLSFVLASCLILSTRSEANNNCGTSFDDNSIEAKAEVTDLSDRVLAGKPVLDGYVKTLEKTLVEREWVVELGLIALIAKEHLLLLGPPGNAKSMISNLMLGNIVDANGDPSYFSIQMTPETTMSETHGPFDFKKLTDQNVYERLTSEGMLHSKFAFVDEIFDARPNALRNLLQLLNERTYSQGARQEKGALSTAFAASNHYLPQIYEEQGERPRAVLDRFALIAFVPGEFKNQSSYVDLIQSAEHNAKNKIQPLTLEYLEDLQKLKGRVQIPEVTAKKLAVLAARLKAEAETMEQAQVKKWREDKRNGEDPSPPYRRTKFHSPRTLFKAASVLQALVVLDWVRTNGQRALIANAEDVASLTKFFGLNGPDSEFVRSMSERAANDFELVQYLTIMEEGRMFEENYALTRKEMSEAVARYGLADLESQVQGVLTEEAKAEIKERLLQILEEVINDPQQNLPHAEITGQAVGQVLVRDYVIDLLQEVSDGKTVADIRLEIEQAQAEAKQRRLQEEEQARQAQLEAQRAHEQRLAEEQKIADYNQKIAQSIGDRSKWNHDHRPTTVNPDTSLSTKTQGRDEIVTIDQTNGNWINLRATPGEVSTSHSTLPTPIRSAIAISNIGAMERLLTSSDNHMFVFGPTSFVAADLINHTFHHLPIHLRDDSQTVMDSANQNIIIAHHRDSNLTVVNYQTGQTRMINIRESLKGWDSLPHKPTVDQGMHYAAHDGQFYAFNNDLSHAYKINLSNQSIEYWGEVAQIGTEIKPNSMVQTADGRIQFINDYSVQTATLFEVVLGFSQPIVHRIQHGQSSTVDRTIYSSGYDKLLLPGTNVVFVGGNAEFGFYDLSNPTNHSVIPMHVIESISGSRTPKIYPFSNGSYVVVLNNGANIHLFQYKG